MLWGKGYLYLIMSKAFDPERTMRKTSGLYAFTKIILIGWNEQGPMAGSIVIMEGKSYLGRGNCFEIGLFPSVI